MTISMPVGSGLAGRIVHLRPPPLRVRFRYGVYINLAGHPDWVPYAAAVVRLGPPPTDRTLDEIRLGDIVTANLLLAEALSRTETPIPADRTPEGWVWAHLGGTRDLALVPAELHRAFRHRGGVSGLRAGTDARGIHGLAHLTSPPVRAEPRGSVTGDALDRAEEWFGFRLPPSFRDFVQETNGAATDPGVHPARGFLVDQPFFGFAAADRMADLAYASLWFGDRFTDDYLVIGPVQGGLLLTQLRGTAPGSIWYWDDDDAADDDRYGPGIICRDLLVRCADDIGSFFATLTPVPDRFVVEAAEAIRAGQVGLISPESAGQGLPRARRPRWWAHLPGPAR